MDNFDAIDEPVLVSYIGKKRKPSRDNHNRKHVKKIRNSGGGKIPERFLSCHADQLTAGRRSVKKVQRRRSKVENKDAPRRIGKSRTNGLLTYLLTEDHLTKIPVCTLQGNLLCSIRI